MKRTSQIDFTKPPTKKPPTNTCIRKIDTYTSTSQKFQIHRSKSKFIIENVSNCPNPTEEMYNCIQNSIDEAVKDSITQIGSANRVGVTISSELLDQGDIYIPISPITDNLVDNIFNLFTKVEQSKSKTINLYGAPFTITVTVLNTDGLPKQRTIKGKGQQRLQKSPYIFDIVNNDNYCLFYALELMRLYSLYKKGALTVKKWRWIKNHHTTTLCTKVKLLLQEARIPMYEPSYDASIYIHEVQKFWDKKFPGEYKIFVFNKYQTTPIAKSNVDEYQFPITILHHDDHFYGIKTLGKVYNHRYYCLSCETAYSNRNVHTSKCKSLCFGCREVGVDYPCEIQPGYFKKCRHCNNSFYNSDCYQRHINKNLCSKFKRCEDCGMIYNIKDNIRDGRQGHICGEKYCRLCKQYHDKDDESPCASCFIQPLKQHPIKPYRIIIYDFECTQDKNVGESKQRFEHEVNFAAANVICTECIGNGLWKESLHGKMCQICGQHRSIAFSPFDYNNTTVDRKVITKNPLQQFVNWLLFDHNKKYPTMAFAHFGGRYDMIMVIREIIAQGIHNPDVIKQGNRLYEIKINEHPRGPKTILHDSFNLMPIKLSGLIKSFGLKIEEKQHFPHMFNKSSNYDNILPNLPPKEYYCPQQKKKEDLEKFELWYDNNFNQVFDLKEKLPEYCCNDVQILTHALVELRREFMELTCRIGERGHGGIDILWQAVTIASACMKNYTLNHLRPDTLAIVPERGYTPSKNQSTLALKYLDWYSYQNNVNIQTANSRYGEYIFKAEGKSYQVDGYIQGTEGKRDKIIEVNGCLWHACDKCYGNMGDDVRIPQCKTFGEIRERERSKYQLISQYADLEIKWEHEINEELRKNKLMREFFNNWIDCTQIKIRDAFHGGRTGAMKLLHSVKPGQKIGYKDFTSLYPYTNFSTEYPLGHPKIISIPPNEQVVNWTKSTDNPYKGLLKVFLQPPNNNLKISVMPIKFDQRLLFPTCRSCAKYYTKKFPIGLKDDNYTCPHFNPNERAFVSTCTHLELNAALDAGYVARKIFHVLQYDLWSNNIFKSYVSEMMAMKIHATGFPSWCITENDKDAYVKECWNRFEINIEKEKMKPDPGKRYISKLSLNSLWGRFSMRNLLSKCIINNDPYLIRRHVEDKKIEVTQIEIIDEMNEVFLLTYVPKEEFVEENKFSNVVVSLYTTSSARLYLYGALNKVAETPNCEVLYYDTDSVIYVYPDGNDPLPEGKGHLGEMTDEKPSHDIVEFISAGCKNYAMKLRHKETGEIEYDLKVKGFTLDDETSKKLHYDSIRDQIVNFGTDTALSPISITYPHCIRPNFIQGKVFTHSQTKLYKPTITKGIVNNAFQVLEFGYRKL